MTMRSASLTPAASYRVALFRLLWPFWLFRDANRGDRFARAAAYRHNRSMRVHLPGYLMNWFLGCVLVLVLMAGAESLAASMGYSFLLASIAAVFGLAFCCGVSFFLVIAYVYLYLSYNDL
jgi:hypothetical protein